MALSTGSTLGFRYSLEQRLGTGGYSEVWRARDAVLDRPVAVKLLHTAHARHAETLARFRSEAQLAGRLSHPNVARVYDFCDSDESGQPYLVMELIDGTSLAELLAHGPLDPARTMDILAQAASGLQAAHAAGLVHRDIKPANIMLTHSGTVKITDFGISHTLSSAPITGTGLLVGTPGYLAPERAAGARATAASDLYALGVVGYECLAGAAPFCGTPLEVAVAHRDRPFPPLPAAIAGPVARFIAELTAKDPAARPADAGVAAREAAELRNWLAPPWSSPTTSSWLQPGGQVRTPAAAGSGQADSPTLVAPLPVTSPPAPVRFSRYRVAAAITAVAVTVAGLIAVVTLAAGSGAQQPTAASSPAATPSHTAALGLIDVRRSLLDGEPFRMAVQQLRAQGFLVRLVPLPTSSQPPGQVVAVRPAGLQPPGSLITVVVAIGPGAGGNGRGHHPHGGGGGDGQGGGND